jgi:hypothetical protein
MFDHRFIEANKGEVKKNDRDPFEPIDITDFLRKENSLMYKSLTELRDGDFTKKEILEKINKCLKEIHDNLYEEIFRQKGCEE